MDFVKYVVILAFCFAPFAIVWAMDELEYRRTWKKFYDEIERQWQERFK